MFGLYAPPPKKKKINKKKHTQSDHAPNIYSLNICIKVILNVICQQIPASVVDSEFDYESQGCEFEFHCGQEFYFGNFLCVPCSSTEPIEMKSTMASTMHRCIFALLQDHECQP